MILRIKYVAPFRQKKAWSQYEALVASMADVGQCEYVTIRFCTQVSPI